MNNELKKEEKNEIKKMMIQLLPLSAKGGTEIALLKEGYKSHELLNENNEQKINNENLADDSF